MYLSNFNHLDYLKDRLYFFFNSNFTPTERYMLQDSFWNLSVPPKYHEHLEDRLQFCFLKLKSLTADMGIEYELPHYIQ